MSNNYKNENEFEITEEHSIYSLIGFVTTRLLSDEYKFGSNEKITVCLVHNTTSVMFLDNIESGRSLKSIYLKYIDLAGALDNSTSLDYDDLLELFKSMNLHPYIFTNSWDEPTSFPRNKDITLITNYSIETEDDVVELLADLEDLVKIRTEYRYLYSFKKDDNLKVYENVLNTRIGCSQDYKKLQRVDDILKNKNRRLNEINEEIKQHNEIREELLNSLSDEERLFYETNKEV